MIVNDHPMPCCGGVYGHRSDCPVFMREIVENGPAKCFYPETMRDIFAEIVSERAHQDSVWGGSEHDAEHDSWAWCRFIVEYIGKLTKIDSYSGSIAKGFAPERRRRMVQIAALACAALQHCPDLQIEIPHVEDDKDDVL